MIRLLSVVLLLAGCASMRAGEHPAPGTLPGLRFELFVGSLPASVDFYTRLLGFKVEREAPDYVSLRSGGVVLGLGPVAKLGPDHFFRPEIASGRRGVGVEIVLEVADVVSAEARFRAAKYPLLRPLATQPWGLTDFRVSDPDGYFIRVTSIEGATVATPAEGDKPATDGKPIPAKPGDRRPQRGKQMRP